MRDLDDLRRAFADETATLHLDLPTDTIRRRARRVRTRRTALGAAAVALALVLAVPMAVLASGTDRGEVTARPTPSCASASAVSSVRSMPVTWLGTPGDTGLAAGPDDDLHDVWVGLSGTVERPSLLVEFRSRVTRVPIHPYEFVVGRSADGEILLDGSTVGVKLVNVEIAFGDVVLYLGLYAGTGHIITIDVNGHETATTAVGNGPTGWTVFWADRRPPPPVQDDIDAPGTRGPVTVRFTVYDDSARLFSQAAMPGINGALLPDRPACTG